MAEVAPPSGASESGRAGSSNDGSNNIYLYSVRGPWLLRRLHSVSLAATTTTELIAAHNKPIAEWGAVSPEGPPRGALLGTQGPSTLLEQPCTALAHVLGTLNPAVGSGGPVSLQQEQQHALLSLQWLLSSINRSSSTRCYPSNGSCPLSTGAADR